MDGEIRKVEIEKIGLNPYQPRRNFSSEELEELALSIKTVGLIHPPVVRLLPPNHSSSFTYELISGERRFRAVKLAGLETIDVMVRGSSPSLSAQAALIENIQRVDLNPLEIAKGLHSLVEEFNFNQELLAKRIGKKRSTIANYLRLLTLPEPIQQSLEKSLITMGHAKAILSLTEQEQQLLLHELIMRDHLSVRKTEEMAVNLTKKQDSSIEKGKKTDVHLDHLAAYIQEKLGTKVVIQGSHKKGRLTIDYYSLDDLDRIVKNFGIDDL